MAEEKVKDEAEEANQTVVVAYVTVHLGSGESFELLPFEDASDVKGKVSGLLEDWSKTGFLIQGRHIYPWHQVTRIEATEVIEFSKEEYAQTLEPEMLSQSQVQKSFWKTKQDKKNDAKDSSNG